MEIIGAFLLLGGIAITIYTCVKSVSMDNFPVGATIIGVFIGICTFFCGLGILNGQFFGDENTTQESLWNDGTHAEDGGEWELFSVNAVRSEFFYTYKCSKCNVTITIPGHVEREIINTN